MKLVMIKNEQMEGTETPRESVQFTLRALKAMQVMCERRLAGDMEPVSYDNNLIEGFLLSVLTEEHTMLLGVGANIKGQIRCAASLLASVREHMPEDKFYELLMVLYKGTSSDKMESETMIFHKNKGGTA